MGSITAFMLSFLSLVAREGERVAFQLLRNWINKQPLEVETPSLEAINALQDEVKPLGEYPKS